MTSPVSPSETIAKAMEGVTHTDAPEWIAVAQDGDGPNGGFWTCAAATTESPRYIRADIYAALARQAEALQRSLRELTDAGTNLLNGLDARIQSAPRNAVPVFYGIVDLSDALNSARALLGGSENAE